MAHDEVASSVDTTMWLTESRDAVVFTGGDAVSYLQSQLSQEIGDLDVGDSRWTLVLAPNGKVDVLARVWRRDDQVVVLDTDTGFGDMLEERLRRFMIRVDVEVTRETLIATTPPDDVEVDAADRGGRVTGWWGRGVVILSADAAVPSSATVGSADDLRAARVRAGWPAMGAEIEPGERIAAELGLAPVAVNFTKGCYPGQELVERMDSRGAEAPRRLCQLTLDGAAAPGDPIIVDGADVGVLTTVSDGLALGYVKRRADIGRPVVDLANV